MPAGDTTSRPELQGAPLGLNGLVFKTTDADATFAHLQAVGMADEPPKSFSRPVETAAGEQEARFRTVTCRAGAFGAGRVYFCEHATPELVWRPDQPELLEHANGASSIVEMIVVHDEPAAEAARFGALLEAAPEQQESGWVVRLAGCRITVLSWPAYRGRFGEQALASAGRRTIFGAVGLECGAVTEREVRRIEGFDTVVEVYPPATPAL